MQLSALLVVHCFYSSLLEQTNNKLKSVKKMKRQSSGTKALLEKFLSSKDVRNSPHDEEEDENEESASQEEVIRPTLSEEVHHVKKLSVPLFTNSYILFLHAVQLTPSSKVAENSYLQLLDSRVRSIASNDAVDDIEHDSVNFSPFSVDDRSNSDLSVVRQQSSGGQYSIALDDSIDDSDDEDSVGRNERYLSSI